MPPPSAQLKRAAAPAKINLFLDVLAKRPDGYHDLRTVFHRLTLGDRVEIEHDGNEPRPPGSPLIAGFDIIRSAEGSEDVPADERNLVWRALERLDDASDQRLPSLRVRLTKRLPAGAGVGGGSSDAAAALRLANAWAKLTSGELHVLAAGLGSDCAFFLLPPGSAEAAGRGDVLAPLPARQDPVLLVKPPLSIGTARAYAALPPDALGPRTDPQAVAAWLRGESPDLPPLHNTFEAPLEARHPVLREIREELLRQGATAAHLTGSGSAVYALFSPAALLEADLAKLRQMGTVYETALCP